MVSLNGFAGTMLKRWLSCMVAMFLMASSVQTRELTVNNELFVEITEMVVPIVQRRDVAGFFSVTLAVDCTSKAVADKVNKYMPIIRDRFFWDLYILLGVIWSPDFRTDVKELKQRLKKRIDQILGEGAVNDVLLINFQQHARRNTDL